jgi:hypothetical protein
MDGPRNRSGRCKVEKNPLSVPGTEPRGPSLYRLGYLGSCITENAELIRIKHGDFHSNTVNGRQMRAYAALSKAFQNEIHSSVQNPTFFFNLN